MTFLEPLLLALILPFVVLPVIIHFINRMRYTPMDWAAMDFLFRAKRSSTKFAKLREVLILACRCLAILCLALALARPLSGGWLGWAFSGSSDTVVILLDRSSSMSALDESGQKNKLEKSIAMIKDSAKNFSDQTRYVLIDSATGKTRTLETLDALDDPLLFGVTDTATSMKAMLEKAHDYVNNNSPGNCEVWMCSDLQLSNWQPDDDGWKTLKVDFKSLDFKIKFRMLAFSHQPEKNIGATVTKIQRYVRSGKQFLDIFVRLSRSNTVEESIQVKLNLNGVETVRDVRMTQESLNYTQTVELSEQDQGGYGMISIPKDRNPGDNSYYFAYGGLQDLKTAILSKGKYSKLLALAAAPIKGLNQQAVLIDNSQLMANLIDSSLIIVESTKVSESNEAQLLKFMEKGGQILVFPPLTAGRNLFKLINPGSVEEAEPESEFSIGTWDELQGPLANSKQGETLPVHKLYVSARQLPASKGEVLASYKDGQPFLSRYGHGKGAAYYCSSGVAKKWSDLYKGSILLPMIKRLVNEGSRQYSSVSKENCRYDEELNKFKVVVGDDEAAFKSLSSGVYKHSKGIVSLNRPAAEDQVALVNEAGLESLFNGLDFSMFNEKGDGSKENLQSEMFTLFAILILLFLAVEGFLTLRKPALKLEESK